MADKRMFSKMITESDAFTDMPLSTQALYFHLNMNADDDGFVNSPKKIVRMLGCGQDDLKLLIAKKFIIPFESGVVVIKHWRVNNLIRGDRYKPTTYKEEFEQLSIGENKAYSLMATTGIPNGNQMETQDRLGKDRLDKVRIEKDICPEPEAAPDRIQVISLTLNDGTGFAIYQDQVDEWKTLYPAVDVMQELKKMKGWLDANPQKRKTKRGILRFVNGWLTREQDKGGKRETKTTKTRFSNFDQRSYDYSQLERELL